MRSGFLLQLDRCERFFRYEFSHHVNRVCLGGVGGSEVGTSWRDDVDVCAPSSLRAAYVTL